MSINLRKVRGYSLVAFFAVNVVVGCMLTNSALFLYQSRANDDEVNSLDQSSPRTADMNSDPASWWNSSWDYRVRVEVNNSNTDIIKETPVEKRINFTNLLTQVGDSDPLDNSSIRVVEYTESGQWVEMRSRWNDTDQVVTLLTKSGLFSDGQDIYDITWTLNGTTQANQNRTFYVYFNSLGSEAKVGFPNYGFDPYHLDYVDYRKIADFSSGATTRNDPWDREYLTGTEWFKDEYAAQITLNTSYTPAASLNYEGWVHQYIDSNNRQTHVGEVTENPSGLRFPIQWNAPNVWYVTTTPILVVNMRVDDPNALTAIYILAAGSWRIVGFTPNAKNTQGGYDSGVDKTYGFEIICDGQWHTYAYDMRRINTSPFTINCIEMFQNTGGGSRSVWMDNMFFYKSNVSGVDTTYSNYQRNLPVTWLGTPHVKAASLIAQCIDVNANPIPNVNVTLVNSTDSTPLAYNLTNAAGIATFPELSFGNYSFIATLYSNVVPGLTTIVNSTVGMSNLTINSLSPSIVLDCMVSRTIFTLKDVNGDPVESGWIVVGNDTHPGGIQNISLGVDGLAYFYWYNVTPHADFKYNFTAYYENASYRETQTGLSLIILATGTIESENRTGFTLWTNLTTIYFKVLSKTSPYPAIPNALIKITNSSTSSSVVNLTTDDNGNVIFRWLIANESSGNSNYTIQISFFGLDKTFNRTWGDEGDIMNITCDVTKSWEFRTTIDLSKYQTALVPLIPSGYIETEWGREIRVRVLFNVTETSDEITEPTGPAWASSVTFQLKSGATPVMSGIFSQVPYYTGWYEAVIDSTLLTGSTSYMMEVSGTKSGYTAPNSISISVGIANAPSSLVKTGGGNTINTWWNDTESISVDFSVSASEQIDISNIFSKMAMAGHLSLWDLQNNWNLTKVVFNFLNVQWPGSNEPDFCLNVTGPDGTNATMRDAGVLCSYSGNIGTILGMTYSKNLGSISNRYVFTVGGNFSSIASGNLTAYFTRNQINATFQAEVASTDATLAIKQFESGWTISYLNITINDVSDSGWSEGAIKLQLPTGQSYAFTKCGVIGCLEIPAIDLYPVNESWVFGLTTGGFDFNMTIIAGLKQVVAVHALLETTSKVQSFGSLTLDSEITVSIDGNQFNYDDAVLRVTNLVNASNGLPANPSSLNFRVTVGSMEYIFGDLQSAGQTFVTLNSLTLASLHDFTFSADASVFFNVTIEQVVSRTITSSSTASISYAVREEPSVVGSFAPSSTVIGRYDLDFFTGVLDESDYTLQIRGVKANFATASLDLDLVIVNLPTLIGTYGEVGLTDYIFNNATFVTYGRNYTLYFNDTHNNNPVLGATVTYSWRHLNLVTNVLIETNTSTLVDEGNGSYTLDFITHDTAVGKYTFLISFAKANYETRTAFIEVLVQLQPIEFELEGIEGGSVRQPQGTPISFAIDLTDVAAGGTPLSGALVQVQFGEDGIWHTMEESGVNSGHYVYSLDTNAYDAFLAQQNVPAVIRVELANYTLTQTDIRFVISIAPPEWYGIPVIYWIIAIGAIVIMVGSLTVVKLVQRARIPRIIKDITTTRDMIRKRRAVDEVILAPTKAEMHYKLVAGDWSAIGLTLPAPEKPAEKEARPEPEDLEKKEASA